LRCVCIGDSKSNNNNKTNTSNKSPPAASKPKSDSPAAAKESSNKKETAEQELERANAIIKSTQEIVEKSRTIATAADVQAWKTDWNKVHAQYEDEVDAYNDEDQDEDEWKKNAAKQVFRC